MHSDPGTSRRIHRYIIAWVLGGALAVVATLVWLPSTPPGPGRVVIVGALVLGLDMVTVDLRRGDSKLSLSLGESAIMVALLLTPSVAVLVVPGALGVGFVLRRTAPIKVVFNIAQHAAAMSVAATIMSFAPVEPELSTPRVVVAIIGILGYSFTSTVALAGVFSRLEDTTTRQQLMQRPVFLVATTLGNASLGVIAVAMWLAYPSLLWVVIAPALALYLAYASSFRIEALLGEVRDERDLLTRVVEGVQEGIIVIDADASIRVWNPAMQRLSGRTAEEVIHRPAAEAIPLESEEDGSLDLASHLDPDVDASSESVRLLRPDGTKASIRLVHGPLRDSSGSPVGAVVVAVDLEREREANALKEDFVARVSHELRTPLSPLRASAQLLLEADGQLPTAARTELLDGIVDCVEHLDRIVDDLLLVSRISLGRNEPVANLRSEPVDLGLLTNRLIGWVQEGFPDRDVHLRGSDAGPWVLGDPVRIGQILSNLLTNGCRYATPGTPLEVLIETDPGDTGYVGLQVRDHGPGIPQDKLAAIFERFHRLEDPNTMTSRGLGVGLYIARSLAESMGGSLGVDSEPGLGSTFRLRLPRTDMPNGQGVGPGLSLQTAATSARVAGSASRTHSHV